MEDGRPAPETHWSSPAVYECFARGERFLWKVSPDFDWMGFDVIGWSANGRYALLKFEHAVGLLDIWTRRAVYEKMEDAGSRRLIGGAVLSGEPTRKLQ